MIGGPLIFSYYYICTMIAAHVLLVGALMIFYPNLCFLLKQMPLDFRD